MTRDTLAGDWLGTRDTLANHGFVTEISWTGFYQGMFAGDGYDDLEFGGRADALFHLDSGKLGLWEGGGFHAHVESRFGKAPASRGGALLPVNTGLLLPIAEYESVVASSLYFTQKLGDFSMMLGKISGCHIPACRIRRRTGNRTFLQSCRHPVVPGDRRSPMDQPGNRRE